MKNRAFTALCLSAALFAWLGCIKREERIIIQADGSATVQVKIEGDSWDVRGGDAIPSEDSGWTVEERRMVDDEGNDKTEIQGSRTIAAGAEWPSSYAVADSALDHIALQFPTEVTVEQRADGTYYHFRRVYERRHLAQIQYEEKQVMESDAMKELKQKEPEELTDAERRTMAELFLRAHNRKMAGMIDTVIEKFHGDVPQDVLLKLRSEALKVFESEELLDRIHRMINNDNDDADFDDLEKELDEQLHMNAITLLRESGVKPRVAEAILMAGAHVGQDYEVTSDLGDEDFIVVVQMPGRLVGHNSFDPTVGGELENKTGVENPHEKNMPLMVTTSDGQRYEFQNEPFQVGWRFKGTALHDRDVVLMATSFVPNE